MTNRYLKRSLLALFALTTTFAAVAVLVQIFVSTTRPRSDSRTIDGMVRPGWPDLWRFVPNSETIAVSPTAEFAVTYRINGFGMRDKERNRTGSPNQYRIAAIGDSFTEGYGVSQDQTYPQRMETLSDGKLECLNFGQRGMSPAFAFFRLSWLLHEGFTCDAVILQLFDNDFDDDAKHTLRFDLKIDTESESIARGPFHLASDKLKYFGPLARPLSHVTFLRLVSSHLSRPSHVAGRTSRFPVDLSHSIENIYESNGVMGVTLRDEGNGMARMSFPSMSETSLPVSAVNELWQLLREFNLSANNHNHKSREEIMATEILHPEKVKRSLAYLDCVTRLARDHAIPIAVVYVPSMPLLSQKNENVFENWSEKNEIPFLSLRDHFRTRSTTSDRAVFFPIDGHLTAYGHDLVARKLLDWLNEVLISGISS